MSGHSKWSTIKRKKEKTDAQRAKLFTKIGREISVCVREGGADVASNYKLKDAIAKAKSFNVPNDNIQRIIKKAEGSQKDDYESITYEGYGPGGVAVIINTLTDNRNRTAANIRYYFDKYGGNLGNMGCVSYMFSEKGVIIVDTEGKTEEQIMEDCFEAGADDFEMADDVARILTSPEQFSSVRDELDKKNYVILSGEKELLANTQVALTKPEDLKNIATLFTMLDNDDDVQSVYNSMENEDDLDI